MKMVVLGDRLNDQSYNWLSVFRIFKHNLNFLLKKPLMSLAAVC